MTANGRSLMLRVFVYSMQIWDTNIKFHPQAEKYYTCDEFPIKTLDIYYYNPLMKEVTIHIYRKMLTCILMMNRSIKGKILSSVLVGSSNHGDQKSDAVKN